MFLFHKRKPSTVQRTDSASFISEISASLPPMIDVPRERREFPSPDHSWIAVFHDPYEWHMGAPGWQLSVQSSKSNLVITNSDLEKMSSTKGLVCPPDYIPWSADSKTMALCFWESGVVLFEPLSNVYRVPNLFPELIQWSPASNHLLTFLDGQFVILDNTGTILTRIEWRTSGREVPHAGWLLSKNIFFVIGRLSQQAKPRIAFIDAEKGTIVSDELLDPDKLVPYNDDKYKSIPRDRHSLVLSSANRSRRSAGFLLDLWNDVIYKQDKGIIFLSIYRPVSKIFTLYGYPACEVKKKWISIKLSG